MQAIRVDVFGGPEVLRLVAHRLLESRQVSGKLLLIP